MKLTCGAETEISTKKVNKHTNKSLIDSYFSFTPQYLIKPNASNLSVNMFL